MKIESPPAGLEALEGAEIFNYGHLPGAAAYCRRLGVVAVVIHSSSHDKRRQKRYDRLVASSEKTIREALKKLPEVYACEPDAKRAEVQAEKLSGRLHTVRVSICPEEVRKRGRPPKNRPNPNEIQTGMRGLRGCGRCGKAAGVGRLFRPALQCAA
ncbi:MAG: hypothetical protein E4H02_07730 [Lentisphaerales bacterium]|jgi:hypothetical protein|nr:MAG: hypothetical protein E4H02_07730 [Lentisphaerales bacterium]